MHRHRLPEIHHCDQAETGGLNVLRSTGSGTNCIYTSAAGRAAITRCWTANSQRKPGVQQADGKRHLVRRHYRRDKEIFDKTDHIEKCVPKQDVMRLRRIYNTKVVHNEGYE